MKKSISIVSAVALIILTAVLTFQITYVMTAGKIAGSTVGLGAIGTGTGVGLAFIPKPHKIAIGAGTGVAIGCFIGLVTGLVTPGLKYHAKQGEEIKIILCDDLWIPKECLKDF